MAYQVKDEQGKLLAIKRFADDGGGEKIEMISNILATDDVEFEAKDFKNKERSFLVTISRGTTDRVGDIVEVEGWNLKNYRKNPVVMPFHDYSRLPVGRSLEEFIKKDRLMGRPQFAPYAEAQLMYNLYRDGYLKGISCGFISIKSEPIKQDVEEKLLFHEPTRHLKMEMLEYSVAPIPAHQDCLSSIKSYVSKGQLYIPARYLQEAEEIRSFVCNEYVHVIETDEMKFSALSIAPIMHDDKGQDLVWVVYGPHIGESDALYFNHKFILKDYDEQKAVKWVEKNSAEVDVNKDEKTGVISLIAFGKEAEIERMPYERLKGMLEAKDPVLIGPMPVCQEFECEDEIELPPSRREEAEISVAEQLVSRVEEGKKETDEKETDDDYGENILPWVEDEIFPTGFESILEFYALTDKFEYAEER